MKRLISLLFLFMLINSSSSAVEKQIFKKGFNLEPKMAENEVFLKECLDVEIMPKENAGYFLDKSFGMIFKIDLSSGKLLKTISSKGQGPQELHLPISLRIRNGRIFVLDKGYLGVKIFDLEGNFIDCFKIGTVLFDRRNLFVNEKNEIFVAKIDPSKNTMVTVYDLKGNELRSVVPFLEEGEKDNNHKTLERKAYLLNLDSKGNIYIFYYILRDLAKFDKMGRLLWKIHIKNELIDQYPDDDYVRMDGRKLMMKWSMSHFDVTENDEIVIGHAGGGSIYNAEGKLIKLLITIEDIEEYKDQHLSLNIFRIREKVFLSLFRAIKDIYIYPYKEEIK